MRYTPLLDGYGITVAESASVDRLVNIIDSCLAEVERRIEWGEHEGRKRKPCPEQPLLLAGAPLGQYHCPVCMGMQMAGMAHLPPDENYEREVGRPWPGGYEQKEAASWRPLCF